VVGITSGIRTFAQSPYIFMSFETARQIGRIPPDATKYVLVTLQPRADRYAVKAALAALAARMTDVDVFTSSEFASATRFYWLFSTGAGLDLILAAFLGVVIGVVITAQTLYASAVDHLPEYATLRAMPARAQAMTSRAPSARACSMSRTRIWRSSRWVMRPRLGGRPPRVFLTAQARRPFRPAPCPCDEAPAPIPCTWPDEP
jgi:hypothetical protein